MRKRGELGVRSLAAAVVAALVCAGVASGADVGANDDTGKFAPDAGAAFYTEMAALGLGRRWSRCAGSRATRSRSPSGRCST